ncbi:MAG: DUF2264 domain-containing protein [Spirochaetales bacterium]|nr:DUF2264 domain-containing protein [Spirochaetales bacterium]
MKGFVQHVTPDGAHGILEAEDGAAEADSLPDHRFVLRNLFTFSAYLHNDAHPRTLYAGKHEARIDQLYATALKAGTDPEDQGYWDPRNVEGLALEGGTVAWSCFMAKNALFRQLNSDQILNIEHWLETLGRMRMGRSMEEYLSVALNHSARKALNWRYDQGTIDKALEKLEGCHVDEGWFSADPSSPSTFDDSAFWLYLPQLCYLMILERDSDSRLFHTWTSRLNRLLRDFPYFYGADGTHPEYGKDISHKFARLTGAVLAHKLGISPLKPGVLKRILRLHISYYLENGAVDHTSGRIFLRVAGKGSLAAAPPQCAAGTAYHALQTVGALLLLDKDDVLWTTPEEKLPVEKSDFLRGITAPGWMLHGTAKDGHIQLVNGGVHGGHVCRDETCLTKYGKFVYSSHLGYVAAPGDGGMVYACDNALSASSAKTAWSHRGQIGSFRLIGKEAIQSSYNLPVPGSKNGKTVGFLKVDTLAVPLRSGGHIRIHRVRRGLSLGKETPVYLREGGFALGTSPGDATVTEAKDGIARVEEGRRFSIIRILTGYKYAALSQGYEGIKTGHTRYPSFLLPRVEAMLPSSKQEFFGVFCHAGLNSSFADSGEDLSVSADGDMVRLFYKGKEFFSADLSARE